MAGGGGRQKLAAVKSGETLTIKQADASRPVTVPVRLENPSVHVTQLPMRHTENDFVDFKVQSQLPRMYSTTGPALAVSAEDKSGRQYIYLGGAKGHAGTMMVFDSRGVRATGISFTADKHNEDVDADFFDMDNDGDEDLYVVSGGYEYESSDRDRLYRNDGNGRFIKVALPDATRSGSCVRPADIDSDGDLDLFVGARLVPGRYPEPPASTLLENDGKGNYSINKQWMGATDLRKGMITDAAWLDINKDKQSDLLITGEFMPLTVFVNDNGRLVDQSAKYFPEPSRGWWNCVHIADMDNDGDADLLAGNYGLNNQYKPTVQQPVRLIYGDYDNNGSVDLLLNYFIGDGTYPSPTRDELVEQIPSFKKKFPDYAKYTTATAETILDPEQLKGAGQLVAEVFESSYFRFDGASFTRVALPLQAQFAPIFAIDHADVDGDGIQDIVAGGNLSAMGVRFGKASGSYSLVLRGDGNGGFSFLSQKHTGNTIRGDIRKIVPFKNGFLLGVNNGPVTLLSLKNDLLKDQKKQNLP